MERIKDFLAKLPHPIRFALTMFIGAILLILGLIMMVTPGPGLLFIFFGLSILALELEWARELNKQGLQGLERIVASVKKFFKWKQKGGESQMTMPFLYSVEREYETSIENLWNAWVDPKALEAWYSGTEHQVLPGSVKNVAAVGGIWAVGVDVKMNNFVAYFYGVYTDVVTHKRLVHTMCYTENAEDFKNRIDAPHHEVLVEFESRGDKSWVKFSQFGELPEGHAPRAQAGMESYFDNLGIYLAK
jgi:uncharacterized protein (TIGR02611 family)